MTTRLPDPTNVKSEIVHMHRDHHTTLGDVKAALMSKTPRGYAVDDESIKMTIRRPYNTDPLGTWCVLVVEGRADYQKPVGE